MNYRRPLGSALLILYLVLLLTLGAGCGDAEDEALNLTLWHVYGGQTDSPLNDLVAEFNRTVGRKEGIRVEVTMVSNNKNIHNHILASANEEPGAAELPDIFVAYPNTVLAMPDSNILVDYRDYFSEKELAAFVPAFLEDGVIDDRLVVLPVAKSTEVLFVNKTAFDRFAADTGATIEDLRTWEGLFRTAGVYAEWTDRQTSGIDGDARAFLCHDFHFNYFQVGTESLGEDFFRNGSPAFGPKFEYAWQLYGDAALKGGLWLQDGYATEPLRTGEIVAAVVSSASVLYFSDEVTYSDNTTEKVELVAYPCHVFDGGEALVMQRGAGMCVVRSSEERERAAMTFLKWLTEPEVNTRFAVSTEYLPVTTEAIKEELPTAVEGLTEEKYIELYQALSETERDYEFYVAPQSEGYLRLEESFEGEIRSVLRKSREAALQQGGGEEAIRNALEDFRSAIGK